MGEKYRPLGAKFLADNVWCCNRGCQNCPFVPRHTGETEIDWNWVKFSTDNPDVTYEEYLALSQKTEID